MGYVCEPLPTDVDVDPTLAAACRAAHLDRWRVSALRVDA